MLSVEVEEVVCWGNFYLGHFLFRTDRLMQSVCVINGIKLHVLARAVISVSVPLEAHLDDVLSCRYLWSLGLGQWIHFLFTDLSWCQKVFKKCNKGTALCFFFFSNS